MKIINCSAISSGEIDSINGRGIIINCSLYIPDEDLDFYEVLYGHAEGCHTCSSNCWFSTSRGKRELIKIVNGHFVHGEKKEQIGYDDVIAVSDKFREHKELLRR